MTRHIWLLVKTYFVGFLKLNQARHIRDARGRAKALGMGLLIAAAAVSILAYLVIYYLLYGRALAEFGRADLLLVMIMAGASLVTLFFSVLRTGPVLFQFKDYELQAAMPIRREAIVASRLIIFYLQILVLTLALMVPAIGVYGYLVAPGPGFYLLALVTTLLIPALPVVLGALLGLLVSLIASRFRAGTLVQIVLMLALVGALVVLSFQMEDMDAEAMLDIGLALEGLITGIYPLARLYHSALFADVPALIGFVGIGLVSAGLFTLVVGRWFTALHTRLNTTRSRGGFKVERVAAGSRQGALYRRELRRYFSSTVYVVNTIFAPLMLVAAGVFALVRGEMVLDMAALLIEDLTPWLPAAAGIVGALVLGMGSTTGAAINIEGRQVDILKSYPVSPFAVLRSKILVNLTVSGPFLLLYLLLAGLGLGVSPGGWPLMVLLPASHLLLVSAAGLVAGLWFPKLEWSNETEAVKQGMSTLLTMLFALVTSAGPAWLVYRFLPPTGGPWLLVAVYVAADIGALAYLRGAGSRRFAAL